MASRYPVPRTRGLAQRFPDQFAILHQLSPSAAVIDRHGIDFLTTSAITDVPRTAEQSAVREQQFIVDGRAVMELEIEAVRALAPRIDHDFASACTLILGCAGRVVVVGMGKSGHIGGKIASTMASTGTPSFFVHPGEASHGDLGMITPMDLVLALSNSGETPEILTIVPIVKRMGADLIILTGRPDSALGQLADVVLNVGVGQEACPMNLAPTSSTTAALMMGDALAVAVLRARGFSELDYARTHPGGALGRRLLLYTRDIMHAGPDAPLVDEHASLSDALLEMTSKQLGMIGVVDDQGKLIGIFTDGDLRRTLGREADLYRLEVRDVMSTNPFTVGPDVLAAEVVGMMREHALHGPHAINGVFVVAADGHVLGALNTHDLLRAGVL